MCLVHGYCISWQTACQRNVKRTKTRVKGVENLRHFSRFEKFTAPGVAPDS